MINVKIIILITIIIFSSTSCNNNQFNRFKSKYNDKNWSLIPNNNYINDNDPNEIDQNKKIEYYDTYYDQLSQDYIGHYKIGQKYQINDKIYQPQEFDEYIEEGVASWYGQDFHGKKTANGEIYDMNQLTAAHPILPIPAIARVTNLDNNKSVILRINDRGPFAKDRIIDLSKAAAIKLGFLEKGTTKVKIEFLSKETNKLLNQLGIKN